MIRIVFLGAPGAGKGTQAKLLADQLGIVHISTGEMLRQAVQAGTALGKQVGALIESGQLVPDDVMISIIKERIAKRDAARGYILDGFPRTVAQAEALDRMLEEQGQALTHVVFFAVSEESLMQRLKNRQQAEGRADDSAQVQQERLRVYEKNTAPLIDFYSRADRLIRIEASGTVDEIQKIVSSRVVWT